MNRISACVVVYNEEKNIERCLNSLRGVVDEIILVHDGECTDNTLTIAKKHQAKIFVRPHVGMMEAHLVFAIEQTTGDWIMRIDADEFLSTSLKKDIRVLVEKENIGAYSFVWRDFDVSNNQFKNQAERKIVLFKKKDLYWFSLPHFAWQSRGRIVKVNHILAHVLHESSWHSWLQRRKKWAGIQAKYLLKDFSELDTFQATKEDWAPVYSLVRRLAKNPLLAPIKFVTTFMKEMVLKRVGLAKSFKRAVYNFYLGHYLFKYSRKD